MDYVTRYLSDAGVRLSIAVTTKTVDHARKIHGLWPIATAALGRTLTGGILMIGDYKNNETLSITVDGDGPLGKIHVDAMGKVNPYDLEGYNVRGYVDNPHVNLPLTENKKLDVGRAVGSGELHVTRFTKMKNNYSSSSPLITGEIGEDLAYYLFMSEQVQSTISVGVLVDKFNRVQVAGGFLVQALPNATDEALRIVEENINRLGPITNYLKEYPTGQYLADRILEGLEFASVCSNSVRFGCTCSRERYLDVLSRLGEKDKEEILQDEVTKLRCHYCNNEYKYSADELKNYFEQER